MWVRSQNKNILLECKNIQYRFRETYSKKYNDLRNDIMKNYRDYLNPKTNRRMERYEIEEYLNDRIEIIELHHIVNYELDQSELLGEYKTKERALEVLDEIQECIDLGYVSVKVPNMRTQNRQVYVMPVE